MFNAGDDENFNEDVEQKQEPQKKEQQGDDPFGDMSADDDENFDEDIDQQRQQKEDEKQDQQDLQEEYKKPKSPEESINGGC